MARVRVLRNTQASIDHTFYVGTTPTDPDGNVATVDITRGDGTVFASNAATTRQSAGVYRYTLAPQANLERFTMLFEGTFGGVAQQSSPTIVEIVGNFYVPLIDIRNQDGLSDTVVYPNAKLIEARDWFEDLVETACDVAFVPRYAREVLDGDGSTEINLRNWFPRALLSVKFDGVAETGLTTWDLYDSGKVVRDTGSFPQGYRNVEIIYEHGRDVPDADLREAALVAIRDRVLGLNTGIPDRATGMNAEYATLTLSVPGPFTPTGIPRVDQVIAAKSLRAGIG